MITDITRAVLSPMVEQPEPSTSGDWYIVHVDQIRGLGEFVGFHFSDATGELNAVQVIRDA